MSEVPCQQNGQLRNLILEYAEALKVEAHTLGDHGLSEEDFYQSGLFRGVIERIRGQFSAGMREKREFVRLVLSYMEDQGCIADWVSAGETNRYDYAVTMPDGKVAAIELKGCLDGNNTNIFERPPHADEFVIWSVCSNPSADPRHNVWSGIHTRLSAEIISRQQRVDGLVVWDWICGTVGRPCPKIINDQDRRTELGSFNLVPPCIYLFPSSIPSPRNNPNPVAQNIGSVSFLEALKNCFNVKEEEVSKVNFRVSYQGVDTVRVTEIYRNSEIIKTSEPTAIRRS